MSLRSVKKGKSMIPIIIMVVALTCGETTLAQTPILTGKPRFPHFNCLASSLSYPKPKPLPCGPVTTEDLMRFLKKNNPHLNYVLFDQIAELYKYWGEHYNVRWEFAFFQMLKETGYLKFGRCNKENPEKGGVCPGDFNFAGLGAVQEGRGGMKFKSAMLGVKAHFLHLLLYAGVDVPWKEFQDVLDEGNMYRGKSYSRDRAKSTIKNFVCFLGRPANFEDIGALYAVTGGVRERTYGKRILEIGRNFCDLVNQGLDKPPKPPTPSTPCWHRGNPIYNPNKRESDYGDNNPEWASTDRYTATSSRLTNIFRWFTKRTRRFDKNLRFDFEFTPPPMEICINVPFHIHLEGIVTNVARTPFADVRNMKMGIIYYDSQRRQNAWDEWGRVILGASNEGRKETFDRELRVGDWLSDEFEVHVFIGPDTAAHIVWKYQKQ